MILVRTPPGVALYKLVLIKPADDPNFALDEGFSDLVFWFDPDFNGHSSGIKPVYPQPLPVSVSKVQPAVVKKPSRQHPICRAASELTGMIS